jgi:hypothetical protein
MNSPDRLFPHPFTIGNLAGAMANCGNTWEFLWDFRRNGTQVYEDIKDAYEEAEWALKMQSRRIIATTANAEALEPLAKSNNAEILEMREKYLPVHRMDLQQFDEDFDIFTDWSALIDGEVGRIENKDVFKDLGFIKENREYDDYIAAVTSDIELADYRLQELEFDQLMEERGRMLSSFLGSIASNSLLTEIALVSNGDQVSVIPYHSHSLHSVASTKKDEVVLLQPGVISTNYWKNFSKDIERLEVLVNQPRIEEAKIEALLRNNPLFMRGLNYSEVHFQVVFPRMGAKDLRPDIVAKPAGSEWWDIIDLKLPTFPILVGKENRPTLSAAISEAASQLREYAAYFENRDIAKRVEQKYGFQCYRPKLVVIIGRDPKRFTEVETRRAMTAYPNLEILTYDKLIDVARKYLLL